MEVILLIILKHNRNNSYKLLNDRLAKTSLNYYMSQVFNSLSISVNIYNMNYEGGYRRSI